MTLEDAIPCSICGCKPVLSGGERSGRLKCPNYKKRVYVNGKSMPSHGNMNSDSNGITMGFTHWCNLFWSKEQAETEGIPTIVKEWNCIHENGITNKNWDKFTE